MVQGSLLRLLFLGIVSILLVGVAPADARRTALEATVEDLLGLEVHPVAIGHRGFGANLGEDPTRPIENTARGVRWGFRAGLSVVEVDVQRTLDGEIVAYHNDFLSDFTCINQLTRREVQARLPHIPTLRAVLMQARSFNRPWGPLRGLVIVELKALSPLCDPGDMQERALVLSVGDVIRRVTMTEQVVLTSFSPALLFHAKMEIPEVARSLTISGLQFLTPEEVKAAVKDELGEVSVTLIDKQLDLGLQWAEIGRVFRLPGYRSIEELIVTTAVVGARVVEVDLFLLGSAGAPLVHVLHSVDLKVFGWTVNNAAEWHFLQSLGVDGIYTNDVPLGIDLQAPIPSSGLPHGPTVPVDRHGHEQLKTMNRR
ncbi:MAG: glycerophosphodiester phosphodiesterase [Candidatus Rokuibacteriota bacterium]